MLQCRVEQVQTSLASRESSPDECLVAEGWIVAGTIMMSNRTNGTSLVNLLGALHTITKHATVVSYTVPR